MNRFVSGTLLAASIALGTSVFAGSALAGEYHGPGYLRAPRASVVIEAPIRVHYRANFVYGDYPPPPRGPGRWLRYVDEWGRVFWAWEPAVVYQPPPAAVFGPQIYGPPPGYQPPLWSPPPVRPVPVYPGRWHDHDRGRYR